MNLINKTGRTPQCLTDLIAEGETEYKALRGECRKEVIFNLKEEQGYLCAYCRRKIDSIFQIEHIVGQNTIPGESKKLDYKNFHGGCSGIAYDTNKKPKEEICHKKKGNTIVTLDLMNPVHIATIKYNLDFTISSSDATIDTELNEVYALNHIEFTLGRSESVDNEEYQIMEWLDEYGLSKEEAYRKGISAVRAGVVDHKEAVITILESRLV